MLYYMFSLFRAHEDRKFDQSIRVAPLVVIPAHQLHEGIIQSNASANVDNRRCWICHEICGDHLLLGPIENTFHAARCSFLDLGYNLIHLRWLVQSTSQINHRHIWGGNSERHSSQLSIQGWQTFSHSLG